MESELKDRYCEGLLRHHMNLFQVKHVKKKISDLCPLKVPYQWQEYTQIHTFISESVGKQPSTGILNFLIQSPKHPPFWVWVVWGGGVQICNSVHVNPIFQHILFFVFLLEVLPWNQTQHLLLRNQWRSITRSLSIEYVACLNVTASNISKYVFRVRVRFVLIFCNFAKEDIEKNILFLKRIPFIIWALCDMAASPVAL